MSETSAVVEKSLRSVFVGNIPYEATEDKLRDIFSQVGPVLSFKLMYDRETGKPKGYGFCEYKDQETALSAMRNLNGYEIGGRPLRVDNACTEKSRMEMQSLMMGPVVESPYGPEVEPGKAPEAISNAVASLPPEQMYELMRQMKVCVRNNPAEARTMLMNNPQLAYALLQAQVVMRIIDPKTAVQILHGSWENAPPVLPSGPPQPPASAVPPTSSVNMAVNGVQPVVPPAPPRGPPIPANMPTRYPPAQAPVPPPPYQQQPQPPLPVPPPHVPPFSGGDFDLRNQLSGPPRPVQPPAVMSGDQDMRMQTSMAGPMPGPPGPPPGPTGPTGPPAPPVQPTHEGFGQPQREFEMRERDPRVQRDPRDVRPDPRDVRDPRAGERNRDQDRDRDYRNPLPANEGRDPRARPYGPQDKDFHGGAPAGGPSRAGPPTSVPNLPAGLAGQDQEKASLIMQVLQLSDEQIRMLPPEQQASIFQLKEQIQRSQH